MCAVSPKVTTYQTLGQDAALLSNTVLNRPPKSNKNGFGSQLETLRPISCPVLSGAIAEEIYKAIVFCYKFSRRYSKVKNNCEEKLVKSNNLKIFTALKKCLEDILVTTYQSWKILVSISTNFKTEKKICVKKEKQSELNLKNFIYIQKEEQRASNFPIFSSSILN